MANPNPSQYSTANPVTAFAYTPLGEWSFEAGVVKEVATLIAPALRGLQGNVQSIFCDATIAPRSVVITNQLTRQYVIFPGGSVGWWPLLFTLPGRLEILSAAAGTVNLGVASSVVAPFIVHGDVINSTSNSTRVDIAQSIVAQDFLAENDRRSGFTCWNAGSDILYLLLNDSVPSSTNYTVQIEPGGYYESPVTEPAYGGVVRGLWASAGAGGARLTEFY